MICTNIAYEITPTDHPVVKNLAFYRLLLILQYLYLVYLYKVIDININNQGIDN